MIEEITLYVPNIVGQLNKALKALAEGQVNLLALSLEQAGAYGIVRLIADDMNKAELQLQKHAWGLTKTKVLAIAMPHQPGALEKVTGILADHGVNVEYGYVAMPKKTTETIIMLKTNKEEEARRFLTEQGFQDLDAIA